MPVRFIRNFIKLESSGGIILFAAAIVAIVLDNSPLSHYYEAFLEIPFTVSLGDLTLSKHLLHWINDGLMVIFFLLVGLEIKREIIEGELNSPSKVILPAAAAIGGMIAPALVFTFFNLGNDYSMRGWAIPTATDIAFSLGILSLLGSRVPLSLKIFLTALAIFDDMGAIIVIALFYTAEISMLSLVLALGCIVILGWINRLGIRSYAPYFIVGGFLWLAVLNSGVHATLAGVALAFAIPLRLKKDPDFSPAKNLEHALLPWIAYLVLPLFALANAGVSFDDFPGGFASLFSPVMLGIALGLFVGKLVGVFGTTFLAIKLGLAKMPRNSSWPQILGIAMVCGVGFTMSFFVGTLAFPSGGSTEPYEAWLRLGVIVGSLVSGTLGYLTLKFTTKEDPKNDEDVD